MLCKIFNRKKTTTLSCRLKFYVVKAQGTINIYLSRMIKCKYPSLQEIMLHLYIQYLFIFDLNTMNSSTVTFYFIIHYITYLFTHALFLKIQFYSMDYFTYFCYFIFKKIIHFYFAINLLLSKMCLHLFSLIELN